MSRVHRQIKEGLKYNLDEKVYKQKRGRLHLVGEGYEVLITKERGGGLHFSWDYGDNSAEGMLNREDTLALKEWIK